MFCPNCGRNVNDTAKFCVGCGTPLGGGEQQNQADFSNAEPKKNKKKSKKWPVFVVFGVLVIACGVFIAVLRGNGDTAAEKATNKAEEIKETLEQLEKANVGEYVTFGTYEQDNNLENGAEPIEWLVLEKKHGKALVLSKYALDCKKYNEEDADVTWETSTLRSWLNDEFYTTAFHKNERSAIAETLIKNGYNLEYEIDGGNDTEDKVFLLSIEEVITYVNPDPDKGAPVLRAKMTEYAKVQGGWAYEEAKDGLYHTTEYDGNSWWWLRSPGCHGNYAAKIVFDGGIDYYGSSVVDHNSVVRPALWIVYNEQAPTPTVTPSPGKVENLKNASVGDSITFGTYEQDNDTENGTEPIEWLVLEKKDGKALLLSKYALDMKQYNEEYVDVTWETCTLRSWLNDEFYTTAFNKTERSAVVQTSIINKDNPDYGTEGGNDTMDKVFLLSIEEVTTYFDPDPDAGDPARMVQMTESDIAKYEWHSMSYEYYGYNDWWLRSSGQSYGNFAAVVLNNGYVSRSGFGVNSYYSVRPALWIAY